MNGQNLWRICPTDEFTVEVDLGEEHGECVANVTHQNDAYLIAAAPRLLEACERALIALGEVTMSMELTDAQLEDYRLLENAIASVKGK